MGSGTPPMGRPGGPRFDEEAPLEPLLAGAGSDAATGGGVSPRPSSSRGLSPDPAHRSGGGTDGEDYDAPHGQSHRSPAGGGGTIRLKRTSTLAATQEGAMFRQGGWLTEGAHSSETEPEPLPLLLRSRKRSTTMGCWWSRRPPSPSRTATCGRYESELPSRGGWRASARVCSQ